MKSIKESKEMERRYKSDSQMWMERGSMEILLRNELLSPEEISRNFHVPLDEVLSIKNRFSG